MKKSKKLLVSSIVLSLVIVAGGGYCWKWKWQTLHPTVAISQPAVVAKNQEKTEKLETTPQKEKERINILILGTDNEEDEVGRSDSIMLVSANIDTHKVSVVSIPRDTRVSLTGVGLTKITHANSVGEMKGGVHGGTLESAKAVSNLLGVEIHYYVKINFEGFQKAVDAIGGVDVNLPNPVFDEMRSINLSAGEHHLSGDEALRLARARYGLKNGDFDRQQDQYYILSAIAHQMLKISNINKLPEVLNVVHQDLLDTNLSIPQMATLGYEFKGIDKESLKYYQLPGQGITASDPLVGGNVYFYEPDLDGVIEVVQEVLAM